MRQGAQGWCTGMTLRDGMGREVGGGSGWGTHEKKFVGTLENISHQMIVILKNL